MRRLLWLFIGWIFIWNEGLAAIIGPREITVVSSLGSGEASEPFSFKLTNTGEAEVTVESIAGSCSCLSRLNATVSKVAAQGSVVVEGIVTLDNRQTQRDAVVLVKFSSGETYASSVRIMRSEGISLVPQVQSVAVIDAEPFAVQLRGVYKGPLTLSPTYNKRREFLDGAVTATITTQLHQASGVWEYRILLEGRVSGANTVRLALNFPSSTGGELELPINLAPTPKVQLVDATAMAYKGEDSSEWRFSFRVAGIRDSDVKELFLEKAACLVEAKVDEAGMTNIVGRLSDEMDPDDTLVVRNCRLELHNGSSLSLPVIVPARRG
jgi:hypothetical protein